MIISENDKGSAARFLHLPPVRMIMTALILVAAATAWLPFPWRMPLVGLLATGLIVIETGSGRAAGIRRAPVKATLLWGGGTTAFGLLAIAYALTPAIEWILGEKADYSGYGALEGNIALAATLYAKALFSAAVGEELVYRGFLLHQLHALFAASRFARPVTVLLGAIMFALPHYEQGISGLISVFLVGSLFGYVFFASNRNIWSLIIAHGLIDGWGIFALYLGWY